MFPNCCYPQALGGHILWILPTFLGTLPDTAQRRGDREESADRLGGLPSNLAGADPITLWNRLLCPQCILQIVGINSINVSIIISKMGRYVIFLFFSDVW